LALCVAALSFWFSNLRVEDNALARIADLEVEPGDAADPVKGYINGWIVARTTFFNAGNRPAVILKIDYMMAPNSGFDNFAFGDNAVPQDQKIFPLDVT